MTGRLALKRAAQAPDDAGEGKRRPATQQAAAAPLPTHEQPGTEPCTRSSTSTADDGAGPTAQRAPLAALQATPPTLGTEPGMAAGQPVDLLPSLEEDEEARQGLLKIADSMRRRVDEGHLQLLRMHRLQHRKQQLVTRGEAVLAEHCAATWRQKQQGGAPLSGVTVHRMQAVCAAGQWWLRAAVGIPCELEQQSPQQQPWTRSRRASLLVASGEGAVVCRQQRCAVSGEGGAARRGCVELQLSGALDVQPQQAWQDADVHVFLLVEHAADEGDPAGVWLPVGPPAPLGSARLSWGEWLRSHGRTAAPPPATAAEQHCAELAVTSRQLDLACLGDITQQLGGVPAAPSLPASPPDVGGSQRNEFVLLGPRDDADAAAGPAHTPLASVCVEHHSCCFATVRMQAVSAQLLEVLRQQLGAGVRQAAAAAGLPPDDVAVERSLLAQQHAQAAAAAAGGLVAELDASIAWVEALLRQKLALGDEPAPSRAAVPSRAELAAAQGAALAAMAATDSHLVGLAQEL